MAGIKAKMKRYIIDVANIKQKSELKQYAMTVTNFDAKKQKMFCLPVNYIPGNTGLRVVFRHEKIT